MGNTIFAGIITVVIYGIILAGCAAPLILMAGTKHNISRFGYRKYILILVGVEVLMLSLAALIVFLLTVPSYNLAIWNQRGSFPVSIFIAVYQIMIMFVLPVYILGVASVALFHRKVRH